MNFLELRIPPPLLTIIGALFIWAIAIFLPGFAFDLDGVRPVALGLAIFGAFVCGIGVRSFLKVGTTINPMKPDQTARLVTDGIYRFSRNPMYLGLLMLLIAWALYLSNIVALLIGPAAFIAYMNRFQISPEERALGLRFGEAYFAYTRSVRRWI